KMNKNRKKNLHEDVTDHHLESVIKYIHKQNKKLNSLEEEALVYQTQIKQKEAPEMTKFCYQNDNYSNSSISKRIPIMLAP
ncbi:5306_t:CDS:2, partial [Racocetra fulgida]